MKKDIHWQIEDVLYIVRNVPYLQTVCDEEEMIDLDVAIKLEIIRDLMYENKIPHDVNYILTESIKF